MHKRLADKKFFFVPRIEIFGTTIRHDYSERCILVIVYKYNKWVFKAYNF